ncbi:MAG: cyclic nucleotide-binding domain-containing protein, partial [Polaromonas sp.]|nr:cyclic nucleotide-binding domain-containing protein [Gemmatimonadaceae bacterium]
MSTATLHDMTSNTRLVPFPTRDRPSTVASIRTNCSACHLRDLCLPCGMEHADMETRDAMSFTRRKIRTGESLFTAGDLFQYTYAVRSGTFKSSLVLADGREQVSGSHMAGELMGMDGLAQGTHASSSTALEDTEVCAIPYAHLVALSASNPAMPHIVGRLMSREVVREHSLMMLLG